MAKKTNLKLKKTQLQKPSTTPIDAVRNPNFQAALAQRNYDNFIAEQRARMGTERGGLAYNQIPPMGTGGTALPQEFSNLAPSYDVSKLIADYQAQRDAPRLMPIQTPGSDALNQDLANRGMGGGIPAPIPQGFQDDIQKFRNAALAGMGERMPTSIPQGQQGAMASQYTNPAMNQMADYNKMLQQGMQRNQDMNQAAQNFAGMGGPQKSFSQVVGGINRMNRAPKPQRNRSLSPSNQKLI